MDVRWRLGYFLLAAFTLVTVLAGVGLTHHLMGIYGAAVRVNRGWGARLESLAELGRLARRVTAPGNDVFESGDIEGESERMRVARRRFEKYLSRRRRDLWNIPAGEQEHAVVLRRDLDRIAGTMARVVAESEQAFLSMGSGRLLHAGEHMAAMDRADGRVRAAYERLRAHVRDIQRWHLDRQAAADQALRRSEWVLAAIVVLMIGGAVVYSDMRRAAAARERHLQDLRAAEARRRAIVDTAVEGIITIDERGLIESVNAAAEGLFGYAAEELIGRNVNMLMPPPFREAHDGHLASYLRTGRANVIGARREVVGERKNGTAFPLELAVSEVRLGGWSCFTGIARDISERKRAEAELAAARDAALEAVRVKSEFLANMSHEIRTPMNGIFGMTDLLLETSLSEEQRDYAETVRRCADGLLVVIDDILDLSKMEAGKLSLEDIDFDLCEVMDDAVALLAQRAAAKRLELAAAADPDVPARARGDPMRVRQVLLNLIANAVKFTEEGEVAVRVATVNGGIGSAKLRFEVADTGVGIPPEKHHCLFQSFSQVDGSTTRRYGGTGLGLSICKHLVELMGGDIGVQSEPGRGSTFWFTLPLRAAGRQTASPPPAPALGGVRVLLVDDNETNRTILLQHARSWRMRGTTAAGGEEAIALLRAATREGDPYRLALIDMWMPGMDGEALARVIRADAAIGQPALVLLSSVDRAAVGSAAAGLFAARLTKPVRATHLHDCLVSVLRGGGVLAGPRPPVVRRPSAAGRAVRILLAEDNKVNQMVAVRMLEHLGVQVDTAATGREAVAALERGVYDLVLMDVHMPEMDGLEATAVIRAREGAAAHTPIVAMTASTMQRDREQCLAAGMDDYAAKPVQMVSLRAVIAQWVPGFEPAGPPVSAPRDLEQSSCRRRPPRGPHPSPR